MPINKIKEEVFLARSCYLSNFLCIWLENTNKKAHQLAGFDIGVEFAISGRCRARQFYPSRRTVRR